MSMAMSARALRQLAPAARAIRTTRPLLSVRLAHSQHAPTERIPFPCVDANELRERRLQAGHEPVTEEKAVSGGPEPSYSKVVSGYKVYRHEKPFALDYGSELPSFQVAYETWGELSEARDNVILLQTGLSASSHAASTPANSERGWWQDYIGPGKALDTNRFFVICTNVLGSCYGSTGPSSPSPLDADGAPYATRFPILSIFDMVRAQFHVLDHLGIDTLYACIGSSMGGMQSIASAHLYPERVKRIVSISGCARSGPAGIALRFAQRSGTWRLRGGADLQC